MGTFVEMADLGHEQVVHCRNDDVGLRAIIAVHSTALGPALGGCRLYNYASEADALRDVLRLSRGMTYKAAVAGLDLGGGKAVIIGNPSIKSEALFRAFGRFVETLGGRYITAKDMNTTVEDMNAIRRETAHVVGVGDDPSPATAWGVYHGIRACLEVVYGSPDVQGRSIAIQGLGAVGGRLARTLHEHGAQLLVTDVSERKVLQAVEQYNATPINGDDFYGAECDVLAPCAIGGTINAATIPRIRAPIIAGGANNQLDNEARDGALLQQSGIVFAPDYVVNAGGLAAVAASRRGRTQTEAMADVAGVFDTLKRILNRAQAERITTIEASNRVAEERIETLSRVGRVWVPGQ